MFKYIFTAVFTSIFLNVGGINVHAAPLRSGDVVVSIKPLYGLISPIMQGVTQPELLISGHNSVHGTQLKPSQAGMVHQAKIIFYIDKNMESFLNHTFESLPKTTKSYAMTDIKNIKLLNIRQSGAWENHTDEHNEHGHDKHNEHDDHAKHDEISYDKHIWLNPENAKKIVLFASKILGQNDPENSKLYAKNAQNMIEKIDMMNKHITQNMNGLNDKPFIVFHDAYQYFEDYYDLNATGSIIFEPSQDIKPKRIMALKDKIKNTGAICVFREPYFSDKFINILQDNVKINSQTLDPEATSLEPSNTLYFDMMYSISDNIKKCLI